MGCCVGNCCVIDCGFCCVFDFCSDNPCSYNPPPKPLPNESSGGGGYSPSISAPTHETKVANELADMKERAANEGRKIGDEAFDNINTFMSQFINDLKSVNKGIYGGKKLNIKIDVIENEIEKLRDEVREFIGNKLYDRLVLTDSELSLILEERDDKKRKRRFDDFYKRVHQSAIRELADKIEDIITRQFSIVATEINNRLNEVDSSMQKALQDYDDAMQMKSQQDNSLAKKQVECMYKITVADIMLEELKASA